MREYLQLLKINIVNRYVFKLLLIIIFLIIINYKIKFKEKSKDIKISKKILRRHCEKVCRIIEHKKYLRTKNVLSEK